MKKYYVEVPYTGKIMVELHAESEEAAIETVMSKTQEELAADDNVEYVEIEEEVCEFVVQGNIFYGVLNRVKVEESESDNGEDENN